MVNSKFKPSNAFGFCTAGLFAVLISGVPVAPAWSAPLQNWKFDPATNQLEVMVSPGVKPRYLLMAQPARLVLDLPDTEVGTVPTQASYQGAVRQVRVSQFQPGITRIVLELAPDAVLATNQAQLQQVQESDQRIDRWVIRPLFVTKTAPATPILSSIRPVGTDTPAPSAPLPAAPPQSAPAAVARSQSSLPPELQSALPPAPPSEFSAAPEPSLPETADNAESLPRSTSQQSPEISASLPPTPSPQPRAGSSLLLSEVNPSLAIPTELPPATTPAPPTAPTVTVPPLDSSQLGGANRTPPQSAPAPLNVAPTVNVPPINTPTPEAIAPQPRPRTSMIEFGQPLPTQSLSIERSLQQPGALSLASGVILPAGTRLTLQYAGTEALRLRGNQAREEVLVLQDEIRDRAGRLIAPVGTPVFGRFETNREGSRFIAQAITLQGQNFSLVGRSDALSGGRQVSDNRLIRNSGLGALAGAILGGLSGGNVLGGAALGAGVTYVTAPRPATIQPGQVIPLQLTEDFR